MKYKISLLSLSIFTACYTNAEVTDQPLKNQLPKAELPSMVVTASQDSFLDYMNAENNLSTEDIDQEQSDNVASLIKDIPGVNMGGSERVSGQTLNIWGMSDAEDVKVTLDGANKSFEKYRQGTLFIEPELLKSVKVNKGIYDITSANGGFGGSVELETKDGRDFLGDNQTVGALVKYGYHTNNQENIYTGAVFAQTNDKTADILISSTVRDADNITMPNRDKYNHAEIDQQTYQLKTNWYPTDNQTITLSAAHTERDGLEPWSAKSGKAEVSQYLIDKYGFQVAWERFLVDRKQKDQNYVLRYQFNPDTQPLVDLDTKLSYAKSSQHDLRSENASSRLASSMGNESWTDYKDIDFDVNNISRFDTGAIHHQLKIGAHYNQHVRDVLMYDKSKKDKKEANFGLYQPYFMPSGEQLLYSGYIQDDMNIGNFTIVPALRYDHITNKGEPNRNSRYNNPEKGHDYSEKTYKGISPYFAVYWQPNDNLLFFANTAKTWRAPVIDEQYSVGAYSVSASSRDLHKEEVTQYRLGGVFDYSNIFKDDDQLKFKATIFKTEVDNEIFRRRGVYCHKSSVSGSNRDCEKPLSDYRNMNGYTIDGLELGANYTYNDWFTKANYTYMKGEREGSPRNPWFDGHTWLADIPPAKGSLTIGKTLPDYGVTLGWKSTFVRGQDRITGQKDSKATIWGYPESSGYVLHGMSASWQPTQVDDLTLRLTVDNFFNKDYKPYLGEGVTAAGRNFKLSIAKQF